ncbi:MAG: hypothetical protein IPL01_04470 [Acidobacteria bacterium]|nr:hypothetical protein [Acidobacteriota bacterium]
MSPKRAGVYYVTASLQKKFGIARVFDTLLDETTILGVAQGSSHKPGCCRYLKSVSGIRAQCARSDPRRSMLAVILLFGAVHQSDGH